MATAAKRCADILHIDVPTITSRRVRRVLTLGTEAETYIVLSQGLLDSPSPDELFDVLGRECVGFKTGMCHSGLRCTICNTTPAR